MSLETRPGAARALPAAPAPGAHAPAAMTPPWVPVHLLLAIQLLSSLGLSSSDSLQSGSSPPWDPALLLPGWSLLTSSLCPSSSLSQIPAPLLLGPSSSPARCRCRLVPGQRGASARQISRMQIRDRPGRSPESFTLVSTSLRLHPELCLTPAANPGHHASPHAGFHGRSRAVGSQAVP